MVILTDCDLFERLCPGRMGMLTHRFITIWRSLYQAEILVDLSFAEHSSPPRTSSPWKCRPGMGW
jgi:hypothetical protein